MKTTLDELLAFRTVVDSGSITAAAEQLGQTVSGISRALGRLEEKLDTTLLNRTTRRLVLTEEGSNFLQRARAILASVDEAEEQMARRRQQPSGRLRVNAAMPYMLHVIVPLVPAFRQQFPQIELEVVSANRRAISLYTKYGFQVYGTRPHGLKYRDGTYADDYLMLKPL